MLFKNRKTAGEQLAQALEKYRDKDAIVLGIPRGGVVVAAEAARILGAQLDVIIPRKIGAPQNPEVAIGAVTQDGTVIKDEVMMNLLGVSDSHLQAMAERVSGEITRRAMAYRGNRHGAELHNKTVLVIDDGIATGFTVKAALESVRSARPQRLVLAVPVASAESITALRELVDEVVCLYEPEQFYAVGQFYADFEQTSDREVIDLLDRFGR